MLIFFIFCKKCKKSKKGIDNFHYRKYNYLVMQLGISKSISKRKKESALIMRKQTKLVAVLSTAALLALGASMSSFAATGWQEENGTWVYYDKNGDLETEKWEKSGDNWFYLNDEGEMATDAVVEYKDNYYYVDENGAMVANKWVSVENEDYGDDDNEPTNHWYYFGSNGKAYTKNGDKLSFKTINGKKYTFDDEGKMLYGWVSEDDGSRLTDDDAWKNGDFYLGDENDGAQTLGWANIAIVSDPDEDGQEGYGFTSLNVFDDTDQVRWFYFKANGKKVAGKNAESINGKKYSFDDYGRMNSEWVHYATPNTATPGTTTWSYYNSPEDGARVTKGWFQAIPDERLTADDYDDDETNWYYSQSGKIVASELKTINGKTFAFDAEGRMVTGLKFVDATDKKNIVIVDSKNYDTEDRFKTYAPTVLGTETKAYFFSKASGSEEGTMKTGKQTVEIDGDNYSFLFGKSGKKGAGKEGEDSNKYYLSGMLLSAAKDDKYALVELDENGNAIAIVSGDSYVDGTTYKLVNTSGAIQKNKSKVKDGLGWEYKTDKNGVVESQKLAD